MAQRPIFIPKTKGSAGVVVQMTDFKWFPGMSAKQKQRSIHSLHQAALENFNLSPILEISSKSEDPAGIKASAFNLMFEVADGKRYPVENIFQAGKVFEGGGPYLDLLSKTPRDAKRDERLKSSGDLIDFELDGERIPNIPRTFFYDWLYVNALNQNRQLADRLFESAGFTDIEFNPKKSINCQAYSAAIYVSLRRLNVLEIALENIRQFYELLFDEYSEKDNEVAIQNEMNLS